MWVSASVCSVEGVYYWHKTHFILRQQSHPPFALLIGTGCAFSGGALSVVCSDIGAIVCARNRRYREVLLAARHVWSQLADVRDGQGIARPCVLTFSCVSLQFIDWCLLHSHGMDLSMSSHTFTYTSQVPAQVLNHVVVSICFASGPSSIFIC